MPAQLAAAVLGIWITAAPELLGHGGPAAMSDHVVGPLVASFALIAAWQVTRAVRWANVALAGWLFVAPLLLGHGRLPALNSVAAGALLLALSLVRGRRSHPFGGGWAALRRGSRGAVA